ncbi:F-box protein SKP2A, partial [Bienertia sinuspersici]
FREISKRTISTKSFNFLFYYVQIFGHIHRGSDWESISLVCKKFLSITNSIRVNIAVFKPLIQVFSILLQGFYSIQKLQLGYFCNFTFRVELERARSFRQRKNQCISDKSLISLSSDCSFLEQITCTYEDRYIRSQGFHEFTQELPFSELVGMSISDEFLHSITEAQVPLNELPLSFCKSYTFIGISKLLKSYPSLKTLVLLGSEFLTNEHIKVFIPVSPKPDINMALQLSEAKMP